MLPYCRCRDVGIAEGSNVEAGRHSCPAGLSALGGSRGSPPLKTLPAKDRAALSRTKRHGSLLSAPRTSGLGFDLGVAVILPGRGGRTENREPFRFAGLATLGLVLELLVVKKQLFPGGKYKITATVDTLQHLVLKFHSRMAPFSLFSTLPLAGKGLRWYGRKTGCLHPPRTAPWTRPVTLLERSVGTNYRACYAGELMNMNVPIAAQNGGDQIEQSRPGKERPFLNLNTAFYSACFSAACFNLVLCESSYGLAYAREQLSHAFSHPASGKRSGA